MVLIEKKDHSLRPCLDLRKLNAVIEPDHFPIPRLDIVLKRIGNCSFYSSLDLSSSYLQIPLSPEASRYCGIITEDNVYQLLTMPFGLSSATAIFSRTMAYVLSGLEDEVLAYLDDLLCFTKSPLLSDHLAVLRKVFERFRIFNLKLSPKKCSLVQKTLIFLGHRISGEGYYPSPSKIGDILEYPVPKSLEQVRRWVGMCSFFRSFIASFSTIVEPLTRLTRKNAKFEWGDEQMKSFLFLKEALTKEPVLAFPDYSRGFHIFSDASGVAIGGVLMQEDPEDKRKLHAISYCSRMLTPSERTAPPIKAEMLAIIFCFRAFKPHIFMSQILLHTDHKPLTYLTSKADSNACLARWLMELKAYNIKIVYVPGTQNRVADALSRAHENDPPAPEETALDDIFEFPLCFSCELPLCFASESSAPEIVYNPQCTLLLRSPDTEPFTLDIRDEQRKDAVLSSYISDLQSSTNDSCNAPYYLDQDGCLRFMDARPGDIGLSRPDPLVIPDHLYQLVFNFYHSSPIGGGHFNWRKTLRKCRRRYYWPGMVSYFRSRTATCLLCQQRQGPVPEPRVPMTIVPNNTVFAKVGLDLCGALPVSSRGNAYILNIICYFSKFVISVPVPDVRSVTVARALLENCYLVYGGMTHIVTDNATTFTSDFYREFCNMLSIGQKFSTPYWSQSNASTERSFRTYQNMLSKYIRESGCEFDALLPSISWMYNTSINESTGESPFMLLFGRDPISALDQILDPSVRQNYGTDDLSLYKRQLIKCLRTAWSIATENSLAAQAKNKRLYDRTAKEFSIEVGDRVLLYSERRKRGTSAKFHLPWTGQFRVISVQHPHALIISCIAPHTPPKRVNLSQIKKFAELTGPACTTLTPPPAEIEALHTAPSEPVENYDHLPNFGAIVPSVYLAPAPELEPLHRYNLRPRR